MDKLFGERLASIIKEKRISQKELANAVGVTEAALSHYIKGDRIPRSCTLAKIAELLGTTSDFLMNGIASNVQEEIGYAVRLIARNAKDMTSVDKMKIIKILMDAEKKREK